MNCPHYKECKGGPVVRRLARIGANSTILPGVEIGENALVGAGSVVVADVPPGAVVAGSPARVIKLVSELNLPQGTRGKAVLLAALRLILRFDLLPARPYSGGWISHESECAPRAGYGIVSRQNHAARKCERICHWGREALLPPTPPPSSL